MNGGANKITDLKEHLNATIAKHRSKGYTAWRDACDAGLSTQAKAQLFGVDWKTARNWENIDGVKNDSHKDR
jgi:hypothetical protein